MSSPHDRGDLAIVCQTGWGTGRVAGWIMRLPTGMRMVNWLCGGWTVGVFVFLYLPIVLLIVYSFNKAKLSITNGRGLPSIYRQLSPMRPRHLEEQRGDCVDDHADCRHPWHDRGLAPLPLPVSLETVVGSFALSRWPSEVIMSLSALVRRGGTFAKQLAGLMAGAPDGPAWPKVS